MAKLLLLEDDELLGETLSEDLEDAGFDVTWVKEGEGAADAAYECGFDCYLLDVNVPGMSGFELLAALRESGDDTPALFLTARSSVDDLQTGFDVGADDYITKPFNMASLLIRIRAKIKADEYIVITPECKLHRGTQTLHVKEKKEPLARREYEILEYYLNHKKRIIGKDEILNTLYEGEFISDATFRVYIKNINKHLDGCAKLGNIRGVGYCFESV